VGVCLKFSTCGHNSMTGWCSVSSTHLYKSVCGRMHSLNYVCSSYLKNNAMLMMVGSNYNDKDYADDYWV
jgi:hypothetical protein